MTPVRYLFIAPTAGAIDMSLSFRTTMKSRPVWPALLSASYARPHPIAPSPMMAATLKSWSVRSRPTAMPQAAEIDVAACPAPNASYSDSSRRRNGASPPLVRMVGSRSLRPVRILWMYA